VEGQLFDVTARVRNRWITGALRCDGVSFMLSYRMYLIRLCFFFVSDLRMVPSRVFSVVRAPSRHQGKTDDIFDTPHGWGGV
jgi:hypothetical protein